MHEYSFDVPRKSSRHTYTYNSLQQGDQLTHSHETIAMVGIPLPHCFQSWEVNSKEGRDS